LPSFSEISSAPKLAATVASVSAFRSRLSGSGSMHFASCAGGVNDVGEIAGHPALERAYQAGKEI
jgi:hypothetical protein